jgi:ADP-heptose:LPS heptosyltransferase
LQFLKRIRSEKFDLVIEARGDIRELLFIVSLLRARFKLSYGFGGGGYLLTHVVPFRQIKHRIEYHLDLVRFLGCSTEDIEWGVYLNNDEKRKIRENLKNNNLLKPFISAHPGARLPLKQWQSEKCAVLYERIIEEYKIPLIILGAKQEKELVDNIVRRMKYKPVVLAGSLNLRELAGILSKTNLFICNDSAPMHIAAAMKTPTVAIFGPSKSQETKPYGNVYRVVEKDFPCRFSCDEKVCHHEVYNECMKTITVDDVFNSVKTLIE